MAAKNTTTRSAGKGTPAKEPNVTAKGRSIQAKTYSVGQLAKLAGVSVRALHHYEAIGLLAPKHAENGYRVYGPDDVECLQQILLYRACGMELSRIGELIDAHDFDATAALQGHLDTLCMRKQELENLIKTVRKTIDTLEGKTTMTDEERFEGLKRAAVDANEHAYGTEARQRYGDEAVDAANKRLLSMDQATWQRKEALEQAIIEQLKGAMASGDATNEKAAQLADLHVQWIQLQWGDGAYSRDAHLGLAQGYLADDRFRDYYDSRAGEGATEFLVAALQENL
ncbi:MAG: MerR family transcriptional regulator [Eggerthellaceae bacterium]|nr:MerR family transcriptional regulator [Eggerthellaceae bacterium]